MQVTKYFILTYALSVSFRFIEMMYTFFNSFHTSINLFCFFVDELCILNSGADFFAQLKTAQLQQPLCYSPFKNEWSISSCQKCIQKNPRTFGSMQSITPESIRRQLQESVTIGELCNIKLKTKVQLNPLSTARHWSIWLVTDFTMYQREGKTTLETEFS